VLRDAGGLPLGLCEPFGDWHEQIFGAALLRCWGLCTKLSATTTTDNFPTLLASARVEQI